MQAININYYKIPLKNQNLLACRSMVLFSIVAIFQSTINAQTVPVLSTYAEIGGFVSNSTHMPFWLRANQWGQVPLSSPVATTRLGLHYCSPRTFADSSHQKARFNWEFGAKTTVNVGDKSNLLLPEGYFKLNWRHWELMVGRKQQIIGIVDTTLTSGSYSWSGNALPIPSIKFGISNYMPLKFLWDLVSIRGSFVHGFYDDPYIHKAYLHQKTFYGRIGKPQANFHLHLGLVHHVIFGGEADYLVGNPVAVNGKLPSSFSYYIKGVVLAEIPEEKSNTQITTFDGVNRIGNHLGQLEIAFDWKIKNSKFLLYRQHPFEDASGLQFQNLPDGLYGLSLKRSSMSSQNFVLQGLLLEYLYTKNQTGDNFTIPGSRFVGGDNYFNHSQYVRGWSYRQHGLGTPFIPTRLEVREGLSFTHQYFPTNRIALYHVGLEGLLIQKVRFIAKFSQSFHYPSSITPQSRPSYRQFSSLLAFDAPLLRWGHTRLKAQIAYDKGGVLPNSFGGYLGVKSHFQ